MARIKYYYDTDTCSFQKAKLDRATITRKVLSYTMFAIVVSAGVGIYMSYFYANPQGRLLREENDRLVAQIDKFETVIAKLETDLEELHTQDDEVYRAILKADPLEDEWQVASGGAVEDDELQPESIEETRHRLEMIDSRVKVQKESFRRLMGMLKTKEEELSHMPSIRPISAEVISGFGYRQHPILKVKKLHTGLDFSAPVGTPVYATADGVVGFVGRGTNGYGIQVDIKHGYGWETKFAHLSKVVVSEGQRVKRGDILAYSGNTGLSKGPHLHYEIKKNGKKIDPVDYFYSDLTPEQYVAFKRQANQYNESMD
jgi:murein DD-endopeptidase MepM/ murein hydrolase activator NlpD